MKRVLSTVLIVLNLPVIGQQIFTELPLNPGFVFERNKDNFHFPALPRKIDSSGYSIQRKNNTFLKVKGTESSTYAIPVEDPNYEQSILLLPNEFISDHYTYYLNEPKASVFDDKAACTAITEYHISKNNDFTYNRTVARKMLCYFDGQHITIYDEKDMLGNETPNYSFYGFAHTEKYIWILSVDGVIQMNKASKQFKAYNPNNSIVPWVYPSSTELLSDDSTFVLVYSKSKVCEFVDSIGVWKNKYPNDSILTHTVPFQSQYIFVGRDSLYRYNKGLQLSYKIPYSKTTFGTWTQFYMADPNRYVISYTKGFIVFDNGNFSTFLCADYDPTFPASATYNFTSVLLKKDNSIEVRVSPTGSGINKTFQFIYDKGNVNYTGQFKIPGTQCLFEKDKANDTYLYYVKPPYFYVVKNNTDTTLYEKPQNYPVNYSSFNTYLEADENYIWIGRADALTLPIKALWNAPKSSVITSTLKIENEKNFVLYPNPSTNFINVSFSDSWNIFDISGADISHGSSSKIDVSNLMEGVYFLKINNEVRCFVKQ